MIKNFILVFALISLLFLVGCTEEQQVIGDEPYIGGEKGLIAEFEPMGIEESGVYILYQDETFPIDILVKNKGEEDVKIADLVIELYGIPLSDFSGVANPILANSEKIEKISELNPEGGETIIEFGDDVKYTQDMAGGFYDANVFAGLIYRYKTYVSIPKVCFKEDFRDTQVCDVDESKKVYSSGAPIQVKSAREMPAGSGVIALEFNVENVGGGEATSPGDDFPLRYDQIAYKITPASEEGKWSCTSAGKEGIARLSDGSAVIRCKLNDALPEGTKYTKQIGLELSYNYKEIIQETVRIKNAD